MLFNPGCNVPNLTATEATLVELLESIATPMFVLDLAALTVLTDLRTAGVQIEQLPERIPEELYSSQPVDQAAAAPALEAHTGEENPCSCTRRLIRLAPAVVCHGWQ